MKKSIAKALFNSHSYFEIQEITDLLKEEKSTGSEQSSIDNYSLLNETRMNRQRRH
jgi:hypothetical protein